jgi:hypothetical protein
MATLADIRTTIGNITGRTITGNAANINTLINVVSELVSNTVASIYDEAEWQHTFTSVEIAANADNWTLPQSPPIKQLLKASVIATNTTEKVYFPVKILSPIDWSSVGELNVPPGWGGIPGYDYSANPITFPAYLFASSERVNYATIPKFCTRIGSNLYVYPRPSTNETNWELHIWIAQHLNTLVNDTDTNSLTVYHPNTLAMLTAALFWMIYLGDIPRGQQCLAIATTMMQSFAKTEEIAKLSNILITLR